MKNYILKEYGSWSVLLFSFIAGLIYAKAGMNLKAVALFSGLSLLINSKQALVIAIRLKRAGAFTVFAIQIITGLLILLMTDPELLRLYPFGVIPMIYLLSFLIYGEHGLLTEIAGFLILCLASLIVHFSFTDEINAGLYVAVSLFFIAGVFKVRVQLKRGLRERFMMVFYLLSSVLAFLLMHINPLLLLPLTENLLFSLTLYRVKLKVTGWIEVLKGLAFLVLIYLSGL